MKDLIEIQTVAFPQNGICSFRGGKELMTRAMEAGMDCVGGIPHYEFSRELGVESLQFVFDLAERYDRMIDVHCDEIDDGVTRYLEVMAAEAWKREMGSRTVAAHACATGSYNDAYFTKLLRALKESGIRFNSCPTASTSLDGRFDTYPKRRGITRIRELSQAGLNVALGQDSIYDPWYQPGWGIFTGPRDGNARGAHDRLSGPESLSGLYLDERSQESVHRGSLRNRRGQAGELPRSGRCG